MLCFLSEEDVGKSMFFNWIRLSLIGARYAQEITDLEKLCGRFNSCRENHRMTVLNEVQESQRKGNKDRLKAVIDEFFQSERKGLEVYKSLCQNNFVALSNNFYMVRPSNSDRRYAHIQCGNFFFFYILYDLS